MQIYIIVLNAAAAILLFAVAPRLGKAAWRAPRGPFRVVSTGCAIMCLLLAMSSVHLLLIQAARARLVAFQWLGWLLGPLAVVQATLAVVVGIWAVVLAVRHWNRLGRAQSMVHVLTHRMPSKAHARQASRRPRQNN